MNIINKTLLVSVVILTFLITSKTILFAESYIPSKFAVIPYASVGVDWSNYNCDINLLELSKHIEADGEPPSIYSFSNFILGTRFEIRFFKNFVFTPEIEFQQSKIESYIFNDTMSSELDELSVGHLSRNINLPLMLNFYFRGSSDRVARFIGVGPKIHYNITKEKDQILPVNPLAVSVAATIGLTTGDEGEGSKGSGSFIGIVVDKSITNIYKDEDFITKNNMKISSIWGENLYIGLMLGINIPIIR